MIFQDRIDAAQRLASALDQWRGHHPLVLAIPRGAVPMGRVLASLLGGELDIVLTHKIGAPGNPEFAIGAVGESGWSVIDDSAEYAGASREWIDRSIAAERAQMARRRAAWLGGRAPIEAAGRPVIVIDDGLATGATMEAALHDVRARQPSRLICAAPVASRDAIRRLRPLCDELVCLHVPDTFGAVGFFYRHFGQVSDDEVAEALRPAGSAPGPAQAG